MAKQEGGFQWQRYPQAEALLAGYWEQLVAAMPPVRQLQREVLAQTSSRLADWLDHLVLADGESLRDELVQVGFEREEVPAGSGSTVYYHPGAIFPRLVLRENAGSAPGTVLAAAIAVEDIAGFLMVHHQVAPIAGTPRAPYRQAPVWQQGGREFLVVERRGQRGFVPLLMPSEYPRQILAAMERWAIRPRLAEDVHQAMEQTLALARALVGELGVDTAAWAVFAVERAYWQRRNKAGQVQKARQDRLGLGWANHDHHTFRSSRETFHLLIAILEALGFRPRERFYAGAEAGWGAQVMEQPAAGLAVFADVDLSPDEVEGDFAHRQLAPRQELGTVGLWCALHGESMLSAGLHHVAGRFDFDAAIEGLAEWGVETMRPFSDFSHLRQAFTKGERWEVASERLERLQAAGQISAEQAARFAEKGAVGSHLENIQRGEGFKGFNQQRVSDIIRRTDPRAEIGAA